MFSLFIGAWETATIMWRWWIEWMWMWKWMGGNGNRNESERGIDESARSGTNECKTKKVKLMSFESIQQLDPGDLYAYISFVEHCFWFIYSRICSIGISCNEFFGMTMEKSTLTDQNYLNKQIHFTRAHYKWTQEGPHSIRQHPPDKATQQCFAFLLIRMKYLWYEFFFSIDFLPKCETKRFSL